MTGRCRRTRSSGRWPSRPRRAASIRCWVYDHLLFRFDGEEATGLHECLDDPGGHRRRDRAGRARHARHVHDVPQPGRARQDGGDPRPRQRRPADPGHRLPAGTTRSTRRSASRPTTRSAASRRRFTIIRRLIRDRPGRPGWDLMCRPGTPFCSRPRGPTSRSSSRPSVRGCSNSRPATPMPGTWPGSGCRTNALRGSGASSSTHARRVGPGPGEPGDHGRGERPLPGPHRSRGRRTQP